MRMFTIVCSTKTPQTKTKGGGRLPNLDAPPLRASVVAFEEVGDYSSAEAPERFFAPASEA